ncbi:hypothetical protein C2S53_006764 [Perilla frutescens var. hirtella]|uniref:Uncharacterized protein n=1 Tax=Perilla frutescens var. hirtella TaxID=608512 RepID=A0AAD4JBZ2_PERFH|nr:hypothetical protein C2S53_006764 [Perilla frutescens var. hirtella]
MSYVKWLLFILLIIVVTNLSPSATAQPHYGCFGSNYTSNSTYATNLFSLLPSLSSNINNFGFYNASQGQSSDPAYASALCRGDSQPDSCRACIQNATSELSSLCMNRRQGVLFKDACTLRYSDEPLYGVVSNAYLILGRAAATFSNPDQFKASLGTLLDDLRGQAAEGASLIKVAAGNRTVSDSTMTTIFGLLQCMPDLSMEDCSSCLGGLVQRIPQCCNSSSFVRMLVPSCTLQYQLDSFYNITRIEQVRAMMSAPPPRLVAPTPSPPGKRDENRTPTIILIVVPISFGLVLGVCLYIFLRKRLKKKPQDMIADDDEISTVESLLYDFAKVKTATNNFSDSNKLGEGGFGVVYKGKLQNGQEMAVKRLSKNSGQGDQEFKNEVLLMAKLQHRNLVRLLGFSLQGAERLLIYEYVRNGSLDCFIFDPIKRLLIDWEMRYKIIREIARGLVYLHNDSGFRIIHRDLKAGNILLDRDMNPKIADFGMARLFVQDESGNNTGRIVGTFGYMAPEYARHGQISVKLDVFSFGVLVLEIISGQKNGSFRNAENGESVEYMLSFAWRNWREGTAKKMIDPVLMSTWSSLRDMLRCIHIGLLCVQENVADRPTMASVLVMLSSFSVTLSVPSKPAFFMRSNDISTSTEMEFSKSSESKNDASISELYPR